MKANIPVIPSAKPYLFALQEIAAWIPQACMKPLSETAENFPGYEQEVNHKHESIPKYFSEYFRAKL